MGGLSWMSHMIQMRRVDWFGWVGWARWSKWVGWVGWARWVDGGNRRLARQSPRNEAKNAKVCKIDNIRYQIIQCNTMQYHKTQCKNEGRIQSDLNPFSKCPKSGWNRWNMLNVIHIYVKQCEIMQKSRWKHSNGKIHCFSIVKSAP